jgi:hypothetical protein
VLIQLSEKFDLLYIFSGMGAFSIFVGIILIFGIKDVILLKKRRAQVRRSALTTGSTPQYDRRRGRYSGD